VTHLKPEDMPSDYRTRRAVKGASKAQLDFLMGMCHDEPSEPDHCLACFAYAVACPPAVVKTHVDQVLEQLEQLDGEALLFDGFNEALVGVVERFGMGPVALYSRKKIFEILMRDGGTYEEACEHYAFNMIGSWVGDGTPVIMLDEEVE